MVVDAGFDDARHDSSAWNTRGDTPEDTGPRDTAPRDTAPRDTAPRERPDSVGRAARGAVASDLPDPRKLARDWITLWQSEISAMAADPEMRDSWRSVMALWAGTMSSVARAMPRSPSTEQYDPAGGQPRTADAPRPPPAAAAPDARDA